VLRVNADQGGEAVRIGTDLGRENAALAACWFDQTVGRMGLGGLLDPLTSLFARTDLVLHAGH